jgi:hypothetical protein
VIYICRARMTMGDEHRESNRAVSIGEQPYFDPKPSERRGIRDSRLYSANNGGVYDVASRAFPSHKR